MPNLEHGVIAPGKFPELQPNGLLKFVTEQLKSGTSQQRVDQMRIFRKVLEFAVADVSPDPTDPIWQQHESIIINLREDQHTDKDLILKTAQKLALDLENVPPDDPVQLQRVLRAYNSSSPMLYDWSDEDLGDAMIIARLPSHKVLTDGPRLTNTFLNGVKIGVFDTIEDEMERCTEWLRSALSMIHTALLEAFSDWTRAHPDTRAPRLSLMQRPELSDTLIRTKLDLIIDSAHDDSMDDHPRLLSDVDVYILKCISQYGDNQFFGKFRQLFSDTNEIVAQITKDGRTRHISIKARESGEAIGASSCVTDMIDVTIERTFVAKLCYVPDDLQPIATVPLRLIQHIDVKDGGFTSSGLLEVSPQILEPDISQGALDAVHKAGGVFRRPNFGD